MISFIIAFLAFLTILLAAWAAGTPFGLMVVILLALLVLVGATWNNGNRAGYQEAEDDLLVSRRNGR